MRAILAILIMLAFSMCHARTYPGERPLTVDEAYLLWQKDLPMYQLEREAVPSQLHATVTRISIAGGSGTGFFFEQTVGSNRTGSLNNTYYLVTNRHVLKHPEQSQTTDNVEVNSTFYHRTITIWLRAQRVKTGTKREPMKLKIGGDNLKCHPNKNADLCCVRLPRNISADGSWHFSAFGRNHIPKLMMELDDIEDVYMVGYPGVADMVPVSSQEPITRKGITATSFNSGYGGEFGEGLLDMGSFPGSSGSPIILHDKIRLRFGPPTQLLTGYLRLLGVLFATPDHEVPTHLGNYIKSYKILEIVNLEKNQCPQDSDTTYDIVPGPDGPTCQVNEPY